MPSTNTVDWYRLGVSKAPKKTPIIANFGEPPYTTCIASKNTLLSKHVVKTGITHSPRRRKEEIEHIDHPRAVQCNGSSAYDSACLVNCDIECE